MPTEPEIKEPANITPPPEVDVSGKAVVPETKPEEPSLQQRYDGLREFVAGIYDFVKTNEDGTQAWDYEKIAEDGGYDPKSLRKKGEIVPETKNEPTPETKIAATPDAKKALIAEFERDPEAFLKAHTQKIIDSVVSEQTKDIRQELTTRRVSEMVASVEANFEDFNEYRKEIAELAKSMPPKDATQLTALYHAAKGMKEHKKNGLGLSSSNRGNSRAGARDSQISVEEEIANKILGASGKGDASADKAMMNLTGKKQLAPLRAKLQD